MSGLTLKQLLTEPSPYAADIEPSLTHRDVQKICQTPDEELGAWLPIKRRALEADAMAALARGSIIDLPQHQPKSWREPPDPYTMPTVEELLGR